MIEKNFSRFFQKHEIYLFETFKLYNFQSEHIILTSHLLPSNYCTFENEMRNHSVKNFRDYADIIFLTFNVELIFNIGITNCTAGSL